MTDLNDLETLEDFPEIKAAEHIGTDLLAALIDELKQLPRPWQSLSQMEQDDVIERLRKRVTEGCKQVVALIAADARPTVVATLDQVTFKGGIEAKLKLGKSNQHRLDLADNVGQEVLIVIISHEDYVGGIDAVRGDADQRDLMDGDADALYDAAVEFVRDSQRASISAVQRKLKIGYNRAARLIEAMQINGVVSAMHADGSRTVNTH